MHFIINIFFIALFLFVSFYMKYPDLYTQNFIKHKAIIFFLIFCFQYVLEIIVKIKNRCKIYPTDVAVNSLVAGLSGVIGYTIYNDLLYQGAFRTYIDQMYYDPKVLSSSITIIIIVFVAIGMMAKSVMFGPTNCIQWQL